MAGKTVRRRKKKVRIRWGNLAAALVLLAAVCGGIWWCARQIQTISTTLWKPKQPELVWEDPYDGLSGREALQVFAFRHSLAVSDFPTGMWDLYEANEDARNYVLDYPYKKDWTFDVDLSGCLDDGGVPLLMQWDERWGYEEYAGNLYGLSGCGPTCLSMAAIYLLQDTSLDPSYMNQFATENGYATNGNGSLWSLISEGGRTLGMDVTEIPLSEERMAENLEAGNLIIAIMGEGVFTTSGHFILFTGVDENGKFVVNDPNSIRRSNRTWDYEEFYDQVLDLWVLR